MHVYEVYRGPGRNDPNEGSRVSLPSEPPSNVALVSADYYYLSDRYILCMYLPSSSTHSSCRSSEQLVGTASFVSFHVVSYSFTTLIT